MLKKTPFHPRTAELVRGQTWRRWSGYQVASAYDSPHDREYAAIRNSAALFDISPLHKYLVEGRDATALVDRLITRDATKCAVGQVLYTSWCDYNGKIVDDGTISRLEEDSWRITSADPSLRWLTLNAAGKRVRITETSESTAALALQGPLSRRILDAAAEIPIGELKYFRFGKTRIAGRPVTISRTGYTGDLGFEIWMDAADALHVWDQLVQVGDNFGIVPAGIWALDVARIEAGLVMLGVDYHSSHHALIPSQLSSPLELGLGWSVAFNKEVFNGKRALQLEAQSSPQWAFVGIEVDWESFERIHMGFGLAPAIPSVAWRSSIPIMAEGRQIGYATSGCWSPLLKKYIALAHVRASHSAAGTAVGFEVTVEHQRKLASATVTALPFINLERKRA